jgi:hypothetical protein
MTKSPEITRDSSLRTIPSVESGPLSSLPAFLGRPVGSTGVRRIVALLVFAFIVRMLVVLTAIWIDQGYTKFISVDSGRYLLLAKSLMAGEFSLNGVPWRYTARLDIPEIFRSPGYPLFLLACTYAGHLELITVFVQIALSCLTVYLVFMIGRQLFDETTGFCGALLYAAEPLSIMYCSQILTETLFATLTMLYLFYFLRLMQTGSYLHATVAALFVAAATYVRPVGYFLPLVSTLAILGAWLFKRVSAKIFLPVVFFLLVAMGLMLPWQVRNYQCSGVFSFSSLPVCVSYWDYRPAVAAMVQQSSLSDVKTDQYHLWDTKSIDKWSQLEQCEFMKQEAAEILISHPLESTKFFLGRFFGTLFNPGSNNFLYLFGTGEVSQEIMDFYIGPGSVSRGGGALSTRLALLGNLPLPVVVSYGLLGALLLMTYAMAIFGLSSRAVFRRIDTIMILSAGFYLLLATGPVGYSRFRHPVMPLICIFAGYGLTRMVNIRRSFRDRRASQVISSLDQSGI